VKCHFERSAIKWDKDGRTINSITNQGGAFVTKKGILRIKKLRRVDSGVYTCRGEKFMRCLLGNQGGFHSLLFFLLQPAATQPRSTSAWLPEGVTTTTVKTVSVLSLARTR